jgi:hypothetical protein
MRYFWRGRVYSHLIDYLRVKKDIAELQKSQRYISRILRERG